MKLCLVSKQRLIVFRRAFIFERQSVARLALGIWGQLSSKFGQASTTTNHVKYNRTFQAQKYEFCFLFLGSFTNLFCVFFEGRIKFEAVDKVVKTLISAFEICCEVHRTNHS